MRYILTVLLSLLPLLMTEASPCQVHDARICSNLYDENDGVGTTTILVSATGSVDVSDLESVPPLQVAFQTGVQVVGDFTVVGTTPDHIVVAGNLTSGAGRIEHWALEEGDPQAWTLKSSVNRAGEDLVGVTHDGTYLYLLDAQSKKIRRAAWTSAQQLSQASFSDYVTTVQLPELTGAANKYLRSFGAGTLPGIPTTSVFLADYYTGVNFLYDIGYLITGTGGSLSVVQYTYAAPNVVDPTIPTSEDVYLDETTVSEGGLVVSVIAKTGTAVEVVDGSDNVIGNAVVTIGDAVDVTLGAALVIGQEYTARKNGNPTPDRHQVTCVRRYGFPELLSDGLQMQRIYMSPPSSYIGNSEFSVAVPVCHASPVSPARTYSGLMGIAVRGTGGDPVVPYGTNMLLVTALFVPASGTVADTAMADSITASVAIPDDPGLVGVVALFQFLIADGPNVRLSEVVGTEIYALSQGKAATGGGSSKKAVDGWVRGLLKSQKAFRNPAIITDLLNSRR